MPVTNCRNPIEKKIFKTGRFLLATFKNIYQKSKNLNGLTSSFVSFIDLLMTNWQLEQLLFRLIWKERFFSNRHNYFGCIFSGKFSHTSPLYNKSSHNNQILIRNSPLVHKDKEFKESDEINENNVIKKQRKYCYLPCFCQHYIIS